MPKGGSPEWRRRKEPVLDTHLQASIDGAGGQHDPATGWYKTLHIEGPATRDQAKEVIQALHRSARHLGVSVTAKPIAKNGSWIVEFAAINKDHGRSYVATRYGDNPPYNPHLRKE